MQNPIGEADLEWILHRNCEGTEQLRIERILRKRTDESLFSFSIIELGVSHLCDGAYAGT